MHTKRALAIGLAMVWAVSAHAQFREQERGHDRFRARERVARPEFFPPAPRRMGFVARPVLYPVRVGHDPDAPICDNPDRDPDAAITACGRIMDRGATKYGYSLAAAFIHRGQAYEDKGDHADAIADFSEGIRLKPGVAGYFVMRGAASEKSGNIDGARSDYQMAASLDRKNQEALNGVTRIETRSMAAGSPTPPAVSAPVVQQPIQPAIQTSSTAVVPATSHPSAVPSPAAAPATGQNGVRVALVIGNGQYLNANVLPNPPNDAHAIADALREIGFDVQEGENLGYAAMQDQLHEFLHKAANASVVLLFYAGHGMQVDGKNYLVPVDAKLAEASDLPFETIEIDKLLDTLGDPSHTNIILLDACRDNPLARSFASRMPATRSAAVATGLAPYSAVGTGTLIAYATAPGQTALDGQGKDSPFTTSLLHFLPTPGLEIRQVLTRVRAEVAAATGNRQIPWDNSSLMGDVVLVK
jgi:tetratricopeptide (TPR) repeat protein